MINTDTVDSITHVTI